MSEPCAVFVGPSLSGDECRMLLPGATIHPPARAGDIWKVASRAAESINIVLIDGFYGTVPAVWHKEILQALSLGCRVLGGGSMGALRAVECEAYGMEGVGRIFEAYRDGVVEDDAEVALVHLGAETGYRPLTIPLINIRFLLEDTPLGTDDDARLRADMLAAAEQIYFMDRTAAVLEQSWARVCPPALVAELMGWLQTRSPKADDARAVLRQASQARPAYLKPPERVMEPSQWNRLVREVAVPEGGEEQQRGDATPSQIEAVRHALLAPLDPQLGLKARLFVHLVRDVAARVGVRVTEDEIQRHSVTVRRHFGLGDASATRRWLADRGISLDQWQEELEHEIVINHLIRLFSGDLRQYVPLLLTLHNRWGEVDAWQCEAGAAGSQHEKIAAALTQRELGEFGNTTSLDEVATSLGFTGPGELCAALGVER